MGCSNRGTDIPKTAVVSMWPETIVSFQALLGGKPVSNDVLDFALES